MKTKLIISMAALFVLPLTLPAQSPLEGTVTASRLNIRVNPGNTTVVGTFSRGDKVQVKEIRSGWLRVGLPDDAAVWVISQFVENGKVTRNVNLRSGPGINYGSYGIIESGQSITVIDKNKEWLKIRPPENISGWIAAQYVQLAGAATTGSGQTAAVSPEGRDILRQIADRTAAQTTEQPPPSPVPSPVAAEEDTSALEKKLPFVDEAPQDVALEGLVLSLASGAIGVTHALCVYEDGKYKPLCFLYGRHGELNSNIERPVRIVGRQRWVRNWSIPVVKVLSVTPVTP